MNVNCKNPNCQDVILRLREKIRTQGFIIDIQKKQILDLGRRLSQLKEEKEADEPEVEITNFPIFDQQKQTQDPLNFELVEKIIREKGTFGFIPIDEFVSILRNDYQITYSVKKKIKTLFRNLPDKDSTIRNICGFLFIRNSRLEETGSEKTPRKLLSKGDIHRIVEIIRRYGKLKRFKTRYVDSVKIYRKAIHIVLLDLILLYVHNIRPSVRLVARKKQGRGRGREKNRRRDPRRIEGEPLRRFIQDYGEDLQVKVCTDNQKWIILLLDEDKLEGSEVLSFPPNQKRPEIPGLTIQLIKDIILENGEVGGKFIHLFELLGILRSTEVKKNKKKEEEEEGEEEEEEVEYFSHRRKRRNNRRRRRSYKRKKEEKKSLEDLELKDLRRFVADGRYGGPIFFFSVFAFVTVPNKPGIREIQSKDMSKVVDIIQKYGLSSHQDEQRSIGIRLLDTLLYYEYDIKPRQAQKDFEDNISRVLANPRVPYLSPRIVRLVESKEWNHRLRYSQVDRRVYLKDDIDEKVKLVYDVEDEDEGEEEEEEEEEEKKQKKNENNIVDLTLFGFGDDFCTIVEDGIL